MQHRSREEHKGGDAHCPFRLKRCDEPVLGCLGPHCELWMLSGSSANLFDGKESQRISTSSGQCLCTHTSKYADLDEEKDGSLHQCSVQPGGSLVRLPSRPSAQKTSPLTTHWCMAKWAMKMEQCIELLRNCLEKLSEKKAVTVFFTLCCVKVLNAR